MPAFLRIDLAAIAGLMLAVVVLLVTVALVIGLYVLSTARNQQVHVPKAGSWFATLLWALPVLAVLGYLCMLESSPLIDALRWIGEPAPAEHSAEFTPIERPPGSIVPEPKLDEEIIAAVESTADSKEPAESHPPVPEWVREPSEPGDDASPVGGDGTLVVVSSGRFLTVEEAETKALAQATAELKKDFHAIYAQSGIWNLPVEVVRDRAIRKRHVEPVTHDFTIGGEIKPTQMYVVHLQVELSPKVRDVLFPYWREQIVTQRLWMIGGLVGLLTFMTGTLAAYFRLDTLSGGAYRNRLKFAAVALIVSAGLLLAMVA